MQVSSFAQTISRRSVLRSGALAGAGAFAPSLPLGSAAWGQGANAWPSVAALVDRYVGGGMVANMVTAVGVGEATPHTISRGQRAFSGGGAVDANSLYRIYSMTKPITGMATMIAIDEGLFALDTPLADILPDFAQMQVQKSYDGPITRANLEPLARPITIRHLLTHTAGLGYAIMLSGPLKQAYADAGISPGIVSRLSLAQSFMGGPAASSLAAFADNLAQLPLALQPGRKWVYSASFDLLGRVLEVASGMDFADYLQERILTPCGMTSTFFRVPRSEAQRLTANYFMLGAMPLPLDLPASSVFLDQPPFAFGGAGLVSSARDYDRFLRMLAQGGVLNGTRVMSAAAVRMGTSDLMPADIAPANQFRSGEYGFGAGGLTGRGPLAGTYGWFGAAGTVGLVNTKQQLRSTLMTQFMPEDTYALKEEFPQAVLRDALTQAMAGG